MRQRLLDIDKFLSKLVTTGHTHRQLQKKIVTNQLVKEKGGVSICVVPKQDLLLFAVLSLVR